MKDAARRAPHAPRAARPTRPGAGLPDTRRLLAEAVEHHRAGRLAEAEGRYRRILEREPAHADALHLLGLLAHQVGQHEPARQLVTAAVAVKPEVAAFHNTLGNVRRALGQLDAAAESYRQALARQPGLAEAHNNLGVVLRQLGQAAEAERCYRRALAARPDYAEALGNLGNVLLEQGRRDEAERCYRRVLTLRPDSAEAHNSLGNALHELGRLSEAEASYRQALARHPDYAEAHNSLGNVLHDQGRLAEAEQCYRRALALQPDLAEAHNTLGNVLRLQGRLAEAEAALRQAIALKPEFAEAHNNLGVTLLDQWRLPEAAAACRQALRLAPALAAAHNNLGVALKEQGELGEAVACYERALALQPDYPEAHVSLAFAHLLRGDYARGLAEYEWRWRCLDFVPRRRGFAQPLWDGGPLAGRTLLLHAEQGLGDAIQFVRYAPLAAARDGRVILECYPELLRLLGPRYGGVAAVIGRGQPLPPFDVHAPLMSLPHLFGTRLETVPNAVPYLAPDEALVARWAARLAGLARPRVGLVWATNRLSKTAACRSLAPAALAPLAGAAGVRFVGLQKGAAGAAPPGLDLLDLGPELEDFADTAAVLAQLDLLITVDTSVAHLAGALGRPAWVLLPFSPDWRWLLDREDSPWYPTLRLFRQTRLGDWAPVMAQVAAALAAWAADRPSATQDDR